MSGENQDYYSEQFGCTPAQYHAGLDKLWGAIQGFGTQGDHVFDRTCECIADLRAQLAAAKAEIERQRERAEKHLRELPVVVSKLNKCREQYAAILNQRPTLVAKVVRELVEEHTREIERQHMAVRKAAVENYPAAKAGLDAGELKLEDLTQTFDEDLADLVALIELARINGTVASDKSAATIAAQAEEIERLTADVSDAAMLIRRLAYRCPGLAVAHQANDWLKRKGLQGSLLKETEEQC